MKVKELIERLSQIENQDLTVYIRGNDWLIENLDNVIIATDDDSDFVCLVHGKVEASVKDALKSLKNL